MSERARTIAPLKVEHEGKGLDVASPVVVPLAPSVSRECLDTVVAEADSAISEDSDVGWKVRDKPLHLSLDTSMGSDVDVEVVARHLAGVVQLLADEMPDSGALVLGVSYDVASACAAELHEELGEAATAGNDLLYGLRGRDAGNVSVIFLCPVEGISKTSSDAHYTRELRLKDRELSDRLSQLVTTSRELDDALNPAREVASEGNEDPKELKTMVERFNEMSETDAADLKRDAILRGEPLRVARAAADASLTGLERLCRGGNIDLDLLWPDYVNKARETRRDIDKWLAGVEAKREVAGMVHDHHGAEHARKVERIQLLAAVTGVILALAGIVIAVAQFIK